jgi:short-subunit dehydrogenase
MFALITGASGGIGYEFAHILARKKYNLVLVARREEKLVALKQELEKKYRICIWCIVQDLADPHAAEEVFAQTNKLGISIDVLINNAGFGLCGEFSATDWQREEEMIMIHIRTLTRLTKLFLSDMIKRHQGRILNLASTAAFFPGPYMAVYYAAKAYVLSFSEALASELHGTGVSVTALCPGPTRSGFQETALLHGSRIFTGSLPSARVVAEYGVRSLMKGKRVAIYGVRNNLQVWFARFVPRTALAEIVKRIQRIIFT